MVASNNTAQPLLNTASPGKTYNTSGSWWAWATRSKAPLACKDRPLVWALMMNSTLGRYEARDTVAAALQGDRQAQRKIEANLLEKSKGCGSEEMKQDAKQMLQLLAQGDLDQLQSARAELRAKYKANYQAKKAQCAQRSAGKCGQRKSSGWCCWSKKKSGCGRGKCGSRGSCNQGEAQQQKAVFDHVAPTSVDTEYVKIDAPLSSNTTKGAEVNETSKAQM